MRTVEIVTFGCRLNAFESEAIERAAGQAGLADAVIVNTCAVTAEAERQARQAIRRARREFPGRKIIVTGCAATLAPEKYAALADVVLDNEAKLRVESYDPHPPTAAPWAPPSPASGRGLEFAPRPLTGEGVERSETRRARAYLQVQQGCDHRCTFCIIPYARGPSRSIPIGAIVGEARRMVEAGCREIVLTGVDLTAYGADLPGRPSLGQMARRLLALVPELPRLRLSSLDPSEIDDDLWRLFASEERLMPHLHLSLQAGDDLVLKRMKRRHSRDDAIGVARRARELRPEAAIGADLIAGFPTEDDEMFGRSLDIVEECGIAFLHVFPYSPRPGTPAARMPAVAPALVRERAARLRAAGAARLVRELGSRVGQSGDVLIEKEGVGRAAFYARVLVDGEPGSVRRVRFVGAEGGRLIGATA
ncbi:MAG TPA: tRNA (N(6)-L-threonylcarbamoyladenosine(37)-C(2))-methylthiotransferase MtaB [Stellaceae bacterium]|jgi:threonylcarbamoyladenosine tRNA methylthiotransferase MtaB|nr:tRNA (N(6)-L-threonylcarbamoyladenosine(37)-C(2))-methylthiotransferase MtaB [Stellaceae bacterium]